MAKQVSKMQKATSTYNRMSARGSRRCDIVRSIAEKCEFSEGAASRYYQIIKQRQEETPSRRKAS